MSVADPAPTPYVFTLSSRALPRILLTIVLSLLAIHVALQYDRFYTHRTPWEIQQLFDLDEEQSVPNWYSSAALGLAALLAAAIAGAARRERSPDAWRWRAMAWIILYMSLDEVAGLHETMNSLSTITWTIPFGLLALVVGAWMLPFVWRLPPPTRIGIIVSGFIYVMGAAGIELISSQFFDESNKRQFAYALNTVLEEGMEMLGIVLLIHTLLRYMERGAGATGVALRIERRGP
jgi:hypothetical protein